MKLHLILAALLLVLALPAQAQNSSEERLRELEQLLKKGEKFQTPEFLLLWNRMAYRCGNMEGALAGWRNLAKQGNPEAQYVLSLLEKWLSAADLDSPKALYALKVFGPGDGSAKACKQ